MYGKEEKSYENQVLCPTESKRKMTSLGFTSDQEPRLPGFDMESLQEELNKAQADGKLGQRTVERLQAIDTSFKKVGEAYRKLSSQAVDVAGALNTIDRSIRRLRGELKTKELDIGNMQFTVVSKGKSQTMCEELASQLGRVHTLLQEITETSTLTEEQRARVQELTNLVSSDATRYQEKIAPESFAGVGVFNRMFLGAALMEHESRDSITHLGFTINVIESQLQSGRIPQEEIPALEKLLRSYKAALRIESTRSPTYSPMMITMAKNIIMECLEKDGEIMFEGGYDTRNGGHSIVIQLKRETDFFGRTSISGRLINRGQGVQCHDGVTVANMRSRCAPFLELGSVSSASLENSRFLEMLIELKCVEVPDDSGKMVPTSYGYEDFYDVVVPEWPGIIKTLAADQEVMAEQRGNICSMIAWITPFQEVVSVTTGWRLKFAMRMQAIERLLELSTMYPARASHLEWALEKTARTLKKLVDNGADVAEEKAAFEALRSRTKETIAEIRNQELLDRSQKRAALLTASQFIAPEHCGLTVKEPPAAMQQEACPPLWKGYEALWEEAKAHFKTVPSGEDFQVFYKSLLWNEHREDAAQLGWRYLENSSKADLTQQGMQTIRTILAGNLSTASNFVPTARISLHACSVVGHLMVSYLKEIKRLSTELGNPFSGYPEVLITDQARRALGIFEGAIGLLRFPSPALKDEMMHLMEEYKALANGESGIPVEAVAEERAAGFSVNARKYYDASEVLQDPVAAAWVELVNKFSEEFKKNDFYQNSPCAEFTAIKWRGYRINSTEEPLATICRMNVMLEDCQRLLYRTLGFAHMSPLAGSMPKEPRQPLELDKTLDRGSPHNNVDTEPGFSTRDITCDTFIRSAMPLGFTDSSHGLMVQSVYLWAREEMPIVAELLDRRIREERDRFSTQNQQLMCREDIQFGKTTIPALEAQELLSILVSDDMIIPQTIRYFDRHFRRLEDGRFQALLEGFLLTPRQDTGKAALGHLVQGRERSSEALIHFLSEGIERAGRLHMPEAQSALMRLLAIAINNFDHNGHKELSNSAERALLKAFDLLDKGKTLSEQERCTLLYWEVALYPYVASHPELARRCFEAKEQLSKIGGSCTFEKRWMIKEEFTKAIDSLGSPTTPTGKLPPWLLANDKFLFDVDNPVVTKEGDKYLFLDKSGRKCAVTIKGLTFTSYYELEASDGMRCWFRQDTEPLFENANHPCSVEGVLGRENTQWVSEKEPLEAIVLTKSKEISYRVVDGKVVHPQIAGLFLASTYPPDGLAERLMGLDDDKEVLAWVDAQNKLQRVEYPALELTLVRSKEDKWISLTHAGFYVVLEAVVSEFEPCSHYLVLEHPKAGRRAIATNRALTLEPVTTGKGFEKPPTTRLENPKLYTYKIDRKTNRLMPALDPERLLYQTCVELSFCRYNQARELIRRLKLHPAGWNEAMKKTAGWMEENAEARDEHPRACALRLQLRSIRWAQEPEKELTNEERAVLETDYINYLDQLNALANYRLSEREELKIIAKLEGNVWSEESQAIIAQRKAMLLGEPMGVAQLRYYEPTFPPQLPSLIPTCGFIDALMAKKMVECANLPEQISCETRPGQAFVHNFLHYYKILTTANASSEEFKAVVRLLRVGRRGQDREAESLRRFLLAVASDPRAYPKYESLLLEASKGALGVCLAPLFTSELPVEMDDWGFLARITKGNLEVMQFNPQRAVLFKTKEEEATAKAQQGMLGQLFSAFSGWGSAESAQKEIPAYYAPIGTDIVQILQNQELLVQETKQEHDARLQKEVAYLKELRGAYNLPKAVANPLAERSCMRTQKGIDEMIRKLEKSTTLSFSIQNKEDIESIAGHLTFGIQTANERLSQQRKAITDVARDYSAEVKLRLQAGLLEKMSFEELILSFGCGDDEAIIQSNPGLKPKLGQLKGMIREYLVQKTEIQKLERAFGNVRQVIEAAAQNGWEDKSVKSEVQALIGALTQERAYDPATEDTLLTFEAMTNMRLRKDQVKPLKEMTGEALVNIELEARTGFGKSKLFIPLWLFLTRQKGRLTMMTVPQSLLEDQTKHLRELLGDLFSLGIQRIDVNRAQANNLSYLHWLNEQLDLAEKEGRIILMSINSLQNLAGLALKESLTKDEPEKTEELLKIRQTLSTRISNFIDESAECLDNRQRFDFAVGKKQPVSKERCNETGELFGKLILDPEILARWNFNFLPDHFDPNKRVLTEDNFNVLKSELATKALALFQVPEEYRKAIHDNLMGKYSKDCEKFFKKMEPADLQRFARLRRQLATNLPRTLRRDYQGRYLLGPGRMAIPARQGNARPNSEFATLDDLLDFTIQGNLRVPFAPSDIHSFVSDLRELQEARGEAARQAPSFKLFLKLQKELQLPELLDLKEADFEKIASFINSPKGLIDRLELTQVHVLPKISIFTQKISASSYSLLSALHHCQAASGTTNPDTLPPSMTTREQPAAPIVNLLALWKNSQDKVFVVPDLKPPELLSHILSKYPEYQEITDSRGLFGDLSPEQISERIFSSRPECKGVVYYDEAGRSMICERGKPEPILREESQLLPEETFIFIRKGKSIGTDTPMPLTCKGLITGGLNVTSTFFEQGLGRMRKLNEGQVAGVIVLESEAGVVKRCVKSDKLKLKDLLLYSKIEEGNERGLDYSSSLSQYLANLIEQNLYKPGNIKEIFKKLESQIITSTESDPLKELRTTLEPLKPKEAVQRIKDQLLEPIKADRALLRLINMQAVEAEFDKYVDLAKLPPETLASSLTGAEDAVVEAEAAEAEAEAEAAKDIALDIEQQTARALGTLSLQPLPRENWDGNYMRYDAGRQKREVVGISINPSPNWKRDVEGKQPVHKPAFQYVLSVTDKGALSIMPLDILDAAAVLEKMAKNQDSLSKGTSYYLMSGRDVLSYHVTKGITGKTIDEVLQGDDLARVGIIAKIYTGERYLNEKETKWIEKVRTSKEGQDIAWLCDKYRHYWPDLTELAGQLPTLTKRTKAIKGSTGVFNVLTSFTSFLPSKKSAKVK